MTYYTLWLFGFWLFGSLTTASFLLFAFFPIFRPFLSFLIAGFFVGAMTLLLLWVG